MFFCQHCCCAVYDVFYICICPILYEFVNQRRSDGLYKENNYRLGM